MNWSLFASLFIARRNAGYCTFDYEITKGLRSTLVCSFVDKSNWIRSQRKNYRGQGESRSVSVQGFGGCFESVGVSGAKSAPVVHVK